jgi:predicted MPP superfamily phosphohydrolase
VLAGVTDYSAGHFDPAHRSDPEAALRGAPATDAVRVLLAHQPRSAAAAAKAGFDLQLSGHTHGGQFYPWNLFVRCSSRSRRGCTSCRICGSIRAAARGIGGRPSGLGRRLRSRR